VVAGQPVELTLTETNQGTQPAILEVGPSTDGFVVSQGGVAVYTSNGGVQPFFIRSVTIQPGQSYSLSTVWNGQSDAGTPVSGHVQVSNQLAPGANLNLTVLASGTATPTGSGSLPTSGSATGVPSGNGSISGTGTGSTSASPIHITIPRRGLAPAHRPIALSYVAPPRPPLIPW
jgi:hypothetical protein